MSGKGKLIIVCVACALLVGGIAVWRAHLRAPAKAAESEERAQVARDANPKTGPRTVASRLRDGAKQITEPSEALGVAQDALRRVESEMSAAADEKTRAALQRKKALIERSIEDLEKARQEKP
ncbi:MAG: hypothetical protein PHU25_11615 [Deltaproteobacteria bacterium]|nr:hypothetical protein [Deltaproteobacteria bacterium]